MTDRNLLVVDWDFFFPNPALKAELGEDCYPYLGWEHAETPYHLSPLAWTPRAAVFFRYGMELPMADGWRTFWDRFTLAEDFTAVLYGDSNVHAGRLMPSTFGWPEAAWHTVSLYDAHHDSGYKNTGSFEKWKAQDTMTCEDWMLRHYANGSRLEVTYPAWRGAIGTAEPEPLVPVERRLDDGTTPDRPYHAIYLCRSGAWVPPWTDHQFTEFLNLAPGIWTEEIPGNKWEHPRPDVTQAARAETKAWEYLEKLNAVTGKTDD